MTLLPVEPIRVTVPEKQDWPEWEDEYAYCSNPDCVRLASQGHHVVRRSETAGPKRWVAVDGVVILNEWPVCLWCHDDLNCHKAWIRYLDGAGWAWYAALPPGRLVVADRPENQYVQQPKSGRVFHLRGPLRERR